MKRILSTYLCATFLRLIVTFTLLKNVFNDNKVYNNIIKELLSFRKMNQGEEWRTTHLNI